ncbi:MAG: hypothetical protein V2I65_04490 [Paracoccaceae bacterium]|nr:hypothetical protein [Paracoccaceae bacterium]
MIAAAGAAPAGTYSCVFTRECVDAAPCAATDNALTVETEEFAARLVTPDETVRGSLGLTPGGATFVLGIAEGGVHLLTVMDADGTARYTVHLPGPGLSITYHGTCTASE